MYARKRGREREVKWRGIERERVKGRGIESESVKGRKQRAREDFYFNSS